MSLRHTLTCTVGFMALHVAAASPAAAAVATNAVNILALAGPSAAAMSAPADTCVRPIAPSLGARPAEGQGFTTSKSAAILGGQPSKLELIAMQQAGALSASAAVAAMPAMPVATGIVPAAMVPATMAPAAMAPAPTGPVAIVADTPAKMAESLPGEGLEPAAGGFSCSGGAGGMTSARFATPTYVPLLGRRTMGSDDFLSSKRLPVSHTTFDAAWVRVQAGTLPRGAVRRALGSANQAVTRDHIAAINAWTNSTVRYVEDRDLYGRSDYWANARATLKRRAGDCEDIAIAKMQLLAAMGVPRDNMYLTIARDLARNADHAMLVVKFDGQHLLLDNATNDLLDASRSYDYRPILSFSTAQKWLHGY